MNSASMRFVPAENLKDEGYVQFAGLFEERKDAPSTNKAAHETATLAGGCFWGVEDILRKLPGVIETDVGYTGGVSPNPTYEEVKKGATGHTEAVLVVFDQMRGDYLPRWKEHFGPGGFRRLMDDGCWFSQCHYPYATTTTGPGHASIMAGTTSAHTGIIDNDWYDRTSGAKVYCATAARYETVGSAQTKTSTVKTHMGTTKKKSAATAKQVTMTGQRSSQLSPLRM